MGPDQESPIPMARTSQHNRSSYNSRHGYLGD